MDQTTPPADFDESDVKTAVDALDSAPFRRRFIRTDCNADDPEWRVDGGQPIKEYVRDQMNVFKGEVDAVTAPSIHSGVFQKFDSDLWLTIGTGHVLDPVRPTPRDLLHVYGPDRDDTREWWRYYRYAWKDKGPNGIIYSDDATIIQQGKLSCNCYSYSAQNSYTLVGVGMLYRQQWGDAKVSIRPYVQWHTFASFTGNDQVPASVAASLGIIVESWNVGGGGLNVESDIMIPAWSQNTQNYLTSITNGGAATVTDGLTTDIFAVTQRKYGIFVYAYLETSAEPQQERNELRFVTVDIDVTVPFVVVEEEPV